MKKILICALLAASAAACESGNITDTRPALVGGGTAAATTTGVFIDPASLGLSVGTTAQLSVRAVGAVQWSSSNGGVASVDANGRVTALGTGRTTITATVNGQSGTSVITVT